MDGRVAVVTGVSRRAGIGFAIARRLLASGARVLAHAHAPHDAARPWGADDPAQVLQALGGAGPALRSVEADLADPDAPATLIATAAETFGAPVDVLVANHAASIEGTLDEVTAATLDRAWAVNARATVLLVQAFARQARPGGRVVLFTSGQHLDPMPAELPYAISKGAVHQMTRSLADPLAEREITVNAVNPGPVDTGWAPPDVHERLRTAFPAGRWGRPDDIAAVVAWLASPEAAWVTGQVIDAEGGFRRGVRA